MSRPTLPLSYADAGVNIDAGDELVQHIKKISQKTHRKEVLGGIGGFSALFELPVDRYKCPVIVSATDGVGTKLKLAFEVDKHDTIGIDLVAMCANDLVVIGAEPLFFLDYYATGHLSVEVAAQVISGISEGCVQAGAALVGGETAEMPGFYQKSEYDLAGFCVGVVEKDQILDGKNVQPGDKLIGLASSGVHSNGYSLVRYILSETQTSLDTLLEGRPLKDVLLTPTKIYVKTVLELYRQNLLNACAHITGGGLLENVPRVLPKNCRAVINSQSWEMPAIFRFLQEKGQVESHEMFRTFNQGIGMVLIVSPKNEANVLQQLEKMGQPAWSIGHITEHQGDADVELI